MPLPRQVPPITLILNFCKSVPSGRCDSKSRRRENQHLGANRNPKNMKRVGPSSEWPPPPPGTAGPVIDHRMARQHWLHVTKHSSPPEISDLKVLTGPACRSGEFEEILGGSAKAHTPPITKYSPRDELRRETPRSSDLLFGLATRSMQSLGGKSCERPVIVIGEVGPKWQITRQARGSRSRQRSGSSRHSPPRALRAAV